MAEQTGGEGAGTEGGANPPVHQLNTTSEEGQGEPKVYDEAYVKQLRDENAERRTKAKDAETRATTLAARLLDTTVKATCKALADADDLTTYYKPEDLIGEDGLPDEHKILTAEAELIQRKPHLRARTVTGNLEQGAQGEQVETFSFNNWLKNAAG